LRESGWEVREGETEERSALRFAEEQMVLGRQEESSRQEFWSRQTESWSRFGAGLESNSEPGFGSGFETGAWAGVHFEPAWEGDGSKNTSKTEAVEGEWAGLFDSGISDMGTSPDSALFVE
jgi:hypothetical protein